MRKVKVPRIGLMLAAALVACTAVVAAPAPGWASPGVPSAPKSVKPVPGNARAVVSWQAPYSNGGHKVTAYKVTTYYGEIALAVNVFRSTNTTGTIVGLKNGQVYAFTVSARNSVGWSAFSARSGTVRVGVPGTPAKPTVVAGIGRATVSWHAAAANGAGVNWYKVTPYVGGATQPGRIFKSAQTHQVMSGFKHGQHVQFKVAAHNKYGWSTVSAVSATIAIK